MDQQILQGLMCMCVHFPLDMHSKLKEMDQEISQGLMCIFIIIYVLKASGADQEIPQGLMCYVYILA